LTTVLWTDLVEGDASLDITADRKTITRQIIVGGLVGPASQRLLAADQAFGVPRLGDEYPGASELTVRRLRYRAAKDTDKVSVTIEYEGEEPQLGIVIDCDGAVDAIETNRDKDGELMVVSYTEDADAAEPVIHKQACTATTFRPGMTITIARKLNIQQGDSRPVDLADYEGMVNAAGWRLLPSSPAKTWMCTAIRGNSQDGGKTYDASFTFQRRKATEENPSPWDPTCVYIDTETNRAPDDVVVGEGIKTFSQVVEADFNALNLDIP